MKFVVHTQPRTQIFNRCAQFKHRMKQIIKLTLLADFSSSIIILILYTFTDNFGIGLYFSISTFCNILFPTLFAVLVYKFLKRKTTLGNVIGTIFLQTTLFTGIYILGLYFWSAAEALFFRNLTWTDTKAVFDSEFSGFIPIVFTVAILIPLLDIMTNQKID